MSTNITIAIPISKEYLQQFFASGTTTLLSSPLSPQLTSSLYISSGAIKQQLSCRLEENNSFVAVIVVCARGENKNSDKIDSIC